MEQTAVYTVAVQKDEWLTVEQRIALGWIVSSHFARAFVPELVRLYEAAGEPLPDLLRRAAGRCGATGVDVDGMLVDEDGDEQAEQRC